MRKWCSLLSNKVNRNKYWLTNLYAVEVDHDSARSSAGDVLHLVGLQGRLHAPAGKNRIQFT